MSDIMLINGDIVISEINDISTVDDNNDIVQQACHNIYTKLGENQFHTKLGNKVYGKRLKYNESSADVISQLCEECIYQDERIDNVISVDVTMTNDTALVKFVIEANDTVLSSLVQLR